MSVFSKWILSVLGAVIIGFVVELIFNDTKISRFMRFITATITLLIVVTPVPSLLNGLGFTVPQFSFNGVCESGYMQYVLDKRIEMISNYCVQAVKNAGIDGVEVDISANYDENNEVEIELVKINLTNAVISNESVNINKQEVAIDAVYGYLKIERDRIVAYG